MAKKFMPKKKDIITKETKIDRIRTPDVFKALGEMVYANYSWRYIATKISKMTGETLGAQGAKSLYEEYKAKRTEILSEDEVLKKEITNTIIDADDQLKRISNITNRIIDDLIEDGYEDKDMLLKSVREIREQIKLQTDVFAKMQQGFDEHKISEQKYIKESLKNLKELEKNHYIKILRKPGQAFNPDMLDYIYISEKQLEELTKKKKIIIPGGMVIQIK